MTSEQKFLFDLNGFLVLENVLPPDQCERLRQQIYLMTHDPDRLPPDSRHPPGGALAELIDHPVVDPLLKELLGPNIRLDYAYVLWRERGKRHPMDLHHGGPTPEPMFRYQFVGGRMFSGLLRVIFELNDVGEDDGGICFLPGSHKSNFHVPPEHQHLDLDKQSPFLHRVSCPAGSVILFTENVAHGGPVWQNPERPRVGVFFSYNHVGMQFHKPNFPAEVIASLNSRRRAYFRDVWVHDFETNQSNSDST